MNSEGEDTASIVKRMKNIRFYGEHAFAGGIGGKRASSPCRPLVKKEKSRCITDRWVVRIV